MNSLPTHYCLTCDGERPCRHEQQQAEFDVRGETLVLDVPVRVCEACGTIEEEEGVDPAKIAFAEYRKRKGLLTPEQIWEIRERYKLSQRSLAALLGMSEATINRYEGGGLQDPAHDAAIRACDNPEFVRDLLKRHGDKLSEWQLQRVEQAVEGQIQHRRGIVLDDRLWRMPHKLSQVTGFRYFAYEKYAAVVVWFCQRLKMVTPTSLNKLLFYADFLHFRSESLSLTGAAYRRLAHGPVPADFGGLRDQMELDQLVEVREVEWGNGNLGEKYQAGPNAGELDVSSGHIAS